MLNDSKSEDNENEGEESTDDNNTHDSTDKNNDSQLQEKPTDETEKEQDRSKEGIYHKPTDFVLKKKWKRQGWL